MFYSFYDITYRENINWTYICTKTNNYFINLANFNGIFTLNCFLLSSNNKKYKNILLSFSKWKKYVKFLTLINWNKSYSMTNIRYWRLLKQFKQFWKKNQDVKYKECFHLLSFTFTVWSFCFIYEDNFCHDCSCF